MAREPDKMGGKPRPGGANLKICFYAGSALPNVGGLELVIDALARRLTAQGHNVALVAPWPNGTERPDDSVYPYPVHRHYPVPLHMRKPQPFTNHLLRVCRSSGFDVVHCHGIYPQAFLAGSVKPDLGAALVATSHGGDLGASELNFYGPAAPYQTYWGLAQMDALVAVNRTYREEFLNRCSEDARVVEIPHGVDLEAFATPAPRPRNLDSRVRAGKYVLFIGRLARQKGVDILLEAMKEIPADGEAQLVIAGTGKEQGSLQAYCDRLGLRDRVRFVGWIQGDQKIYLLQNCLCVVVPSRRREAFGLAILESYAAGRPVVASNIPSLDERVEHERSGLLVPPKSPSDLAAALRRLLCRPELAEEMGRRARKTASRYGWDGVVEQHLALYEQLVSSARVNQL